MKEYAEELKQLGVEVTARWFDETVPHTVTMADLPDKYHEETALIDLYDIDRADALVLFAGTPNDYANIAVGALARGGRHVELGYALATDKDVIVCGPKENVFHHLPQIKQFDTWEQTKDYLTNAN